jgi:hypothetical protein
LTGARIIYVTGMKPKPPPERHRTELLRVFHAALARSHPSAAAWLTARAENFVLVSWTRHFYDFTRDIALDLPGIERMLAEPVASEQDRREIDALPRRLVRAWHLFGDSFPWVTSIVAPKDLQLTLSEVHRYLENRDGVADRIRGMLRTALTAAWTAGERIAVVGHSLGSVIALDTLAALGREHAGRADLLLTLGSPLATRFIRKAVQAVVREGHGPDEAFAEHWVNMSARSELVALHPRLEPFFGATGLDVHKSYGYLNHAKVAACIGDWIEAAAS